MGNLLTLELEFQFPSEYLLTFLYFQTNRCLPFIPNNVTNDVVIFRNINETGASDLTYGVIRDLKKIKFNNSNNNNNFLGLFLGSKVRLGKSVEISRLEKYWRENYK